MNHCSTNFNIRLFHKNDLDQVYTILQELSHFKPPLEDHSNILKAYYSQDVIGLVCTIEDEIIGVGFIYFIRKIRGGLVGQIEDVAILSKYQGLGYGSQLVRRLLALAFEKNCYVVSLVTSNKNIAFYEKLNFLTAETEMRQKLFYH